MTAWEHSSSHILIPKPSVPSSAIKGHHDPHHHLWQNSSNHHPWNLNGLFCHVSGSHCLCVCVTLWCYHLITLPGLLQPLCSINHSGRLMRPVYIILLCFPVANVLCVTPGFIMYQPAKLRHVPVTSLLWLAAQSAFSQPQIPTVPPFSLSLLLQQNV